MTDCKTDITPMEGNYQFNPDRAGQVDVPYSSLLGGLLFPKTIGET